MIDKRDFMPWIKFPSRFGSFLSILSRFFAMEKNALQTHFKRTDGWTEGRCVLQICVAASKNSKVKIFGSIYYDVKS